MIPLRVLKIEAFERDVRLRLPFRFGVVTLTEAPQAFLRALVKPEGRPERWGCAAELLAPKWFDKDPTLSNQRNFDQLREALRLASRRYLKETAPRAAFQLFSRNWTDLVAEGAAVNLNPLIMAFASSLLDRAILDALCRAVGISFPQAIRENLPGLTAIDETPELGGFDFGPFLATLSPRDSIQIRHTVGLLDRLSGSESEESPNDGLPATLEEVIEFYGNRFFKVKASGDEECDLTRFESIAAILDRLPDYSLTLDGNEQFRSIESVVSLLAKMRERPTLRRFTNAILWIEQPLPRATALSESIAAAKSLPPIIIDESDGQLAAFVEARRLGYSGVSSKACKGVYRSLLNAARCACWNQGGEARHFLTGEDLTTQAGIAVQQDLILVSLLGLGHVEKNGHHYVRGMKGVPWAEQSAFLASHPDLYVNDLGVARLNVREGAVRIGSLHCRGFASRCEPDWGALRPLPL